MTQTIEVSARTVDDAVEKGLAELGVSQTEVQIEVLEEGDSGGLFGFGRKDAIVRISVSESTEVVETAQAKQAVNDKEQTQTVDPEVNLAEQEEIGRAHV